MRWHALTSRGAIALPFVFGAVVLRLAVPPAADAIASALMLAAPARANDASPTRSGGGDGARAHDGQNVLAPNELHEAHAWEGSGQARPVRVASRSPAALPGPVPTDVSGPSSGPRLLVDAAVGAGSDAQTDAPRATFVVPASVVTRALEKRDVGASNALARDGSPLGARLGGVSRYRTGLRDGDVVLSVGGQRTPTVAAMVSAAMAAASGGAKSLSSRVARGDATYAVVLELPK
jgi:hypothetical protein